MRVSSELASLLIVTKSHCSGAEREAIGGGQGGQKVGLPCNCLHVLTHALRSRPGGKSTRTRWSHLSPAGWWSTVAPAVLSFAASTHVSMRFSVSNALQSGELASPLLASSLPAPIFSCSNLCDASHVADFLRANQCWCDYFQLQGLRFNVFV